MSQIHLRRFGFDWEAKSTIRSFRIEQDVKEMLPTSDLCLNLWHPDSDSNLLPEALKGIEIYSCLSGNNPTFVCNVILRDPRVIKKLEEIADRLIAKLAIEMPGLKANELRRAYGKMEWGQLLQSKMIKGKREVVLKMDMSEVVTPLRLIEQKNGGGYGRSNDKVELDISHIHAARRIFPRVWIKSIECMAQSIKIVVVAKRVDLFQTTER